MCVNVNIVNKNVHNALQSNAKYEILMDCQWRRRCAKRGKGEGEGG